jgi:hypothetical protein
MLDDISVYKDTKRNEKCPCGSGKIFKQCCMKEYREAKKNKPNVAISTYSPLPSLSRGEQKFFTEFYIELMIFSNQYKNGSDVVIIEDEFQNTKKFVQHERIYFYENCDNIIDKFIIEKKPNEDEVLILDALREARLEEYFLISKSDENAVIMDKKENIYNIKALNSPFTEIFNQKMKYMGINTALIPYKNKYITDGIYEGFVLDDEFEKYFDHLPYKNPSIIYNKNDDLRNQEFAINFTIGCDIERFKEMEEIILKKIPDNFARGMLKLFQNEYSYKEELISSFIRTSDFLELLENKEGNQILSYIFGGLPVTNYERGNRDGIIKYELLEYYYKQVQIEDSISFWAYEETIKSNKNQGFFEQKKDFSSFYTILGISNVEGDEGAEKFENFLDTFKEKKQQERLIIGLENLFDDLSKEAGFEIYPIFLDVCADLNDIENQIIEYIDYMKNIHGISINKGK